MPIEKLRRVRLATVAILALVLLTGFLLGAVWDQRMDAELGSATGEGAVPTRTRGGRRPAIYDRVIPTLSAEQLAAVTVIVAHRREAVQALLKEARIDSLYVAMKSAERVFKEVYNPRLEALVEGSHDAIKLVMTPAQVADFDSLFRSGPRMGRMGRGGPPMGRGGPPPGIRRP
jgi:hypothetical protein